MLHFNVSRNGRVKHFLNIFLINKIKPQCYFYHEEEYVRELYPTIETVAKTIETIGYKVPELNDDAKKIIGLFSSNKKLLKNRTASTE